MTPAALRSCIDGLRTAAASMALVAEHHGGARQALAATAERVPQVWSAPPARLLHGSLASYATGLAVVAPALHEAGNTLRSLATVADELAMELQRHLRRAEEATASATAARGQLASVPPDDPMQRRVLMIRIEAHDDARRAAERAADDVQVRWTAACRRTEAQLRHITGSVRGTLSRADVTFPAAHIVLGATAGPFGSLFAALVGFGQAGAHRASPFAPRHTGLTDFVRQLGPGPYTAEQYREFAAEYVRTLLPEGREGDALARNAAVTRAYAELYFLDPAAYKWAGMAAFASDLVGDGIRQADAGRQSGIPWIPWLTDISFTRLSRALQRGNALVYSDIYWQHLAYEHGGLEAVERARDDGLVPDRVYAAWRLVDEGRTAADPVLVWQGNEQLLLYEQEVTLQPVYDDNRKAFQRLSSGAIALIAPLESPIPGDPVTFRDHGGTDIGDFDQRWAWIEESMLSAWRDEEPGLTDQLWAFTR